MRILLEPTGYHFLNVGDVAMRQVAIRRLRELWPDATIQVIADDADELARYCPGTELVPAEGQRQWLYGTVAGRAARRLPGRSQRRLVRAEERARVRASRPLLAATRAARRVRGGDVDAIDAYLTAVHAADTLVVAGGGLVTDAFGPYALVVLRELEVAIRGGTPTFMFGQGIGPIHDAELRRAAARVLPRVTAISVREGRASPAALAALGVAAARISVTGDDALELVRPLLGGSGDRLGVNVRVAGYAPMSKGAAARVQQAVRAAAFEHDAQLLAVPISRHPGESDLATVRRLFPDAEGDEASTAEDAIRVAARCRVVITGSYHAGVFALGQGIPCVGLVTSQFYRDKFLGLAEQFPGGCSVVDVDAPDAEARLAAAVAEAWQPREERRSDLLASAQRQIEASRAAYARARDLIDARRA
jgi:polysaccharide pyruvyl transferase WcaK-like protein